VTDATASSQRRRGVIGRVRRLALVALALWLAGGVVAGALHRRVLGYRWRAVRLSRPVVVIESDDWGGGYLSSYVTSDEDFRQRVEAQQAAAVERLAALVKRHTDAAGRHAVVSAFAVVGQADIPAILADPEHGYHWTPTDRTLPGLVAALRRAEEQGAFAIEYHARDHKNLRAWTAALVAAAEEADAQGRPLTPGTVNALWPDDPDARNVMMTEYHRRRSGRADGLEELPAEEIRAKVSAGVSAFERMFGRRPTATVAPKYLWGPRTERVWREWGLRSVHGANWQAGPDAPVEAPWERELGLRGAAGVVYVPRITDNGIGADGRIPATESRMAHVRRALRSGRPAVISTHSWCYCLAGPEKAETMYRRLDELLSAIEREYPDLRYLASAELAELAERGRVEIARGEGRTETVTAASGLEHAWLFAAAALDEHGKIRLWAYGAAGLAVLAAAAAAAAVGRRGGAKREEGGR
jgi:hypothetical protein